MRNEPRPTWSQPRLVHHRPRLLFWMIALALSIAVAVAAIAFAAGPPHPADAVGAVGAEAAVDPSPRPGPVEPTRWPANGQAALAVDGVGEIGSSGGHQPVPIASLAKMMTAYVVLRDHPRFDDGFTLVITPAAVRDTDARRRRGESVVRVRAGETLTERQALIAVLLPSANNIAVTLAAHDAGSVTAFVDRMNRTARGLGMNDTHYTDPSGYDPGTVSTAVDQLRLTSVVMHVPAFADLVGRREAELPQVGLVHNTNTLVGRDGFVGTKTGSDSAAGGCLAFTFERRSGARTTRVFGVVLGQRGGPLIPAAIAAARRLVL